MTVNFDDCTAQKRFGFRSSDSRVRVQTDGALTVSKHLNALKFDLYLPEGNRRALFYSLPRP